MAVRYNCLRLFVFPHHLLLMKEGSFVVVEQPRCSPPAIAAPGGNPHSRGSWPDPGREGHHPEHPLSHLCGSCTWPLRVNTSDSPVDRYRDKKAWTRGLSWHPSGPRTPGDDLDAGRADTRRPLSSPPLTASPPSRCAHTPAGCGHGGTRKSSTSRSVQTWSVRPAAIAGVQGRHCVVEPVPWVDSGWGRGWHTLAWGKQKL